ncbi:MAG: glycoside hydrolase family 19 protein [Polyangiales bacterium]
MRVTRSLLTNMGVSEARITRYLPALRRALPAHEIDTPLRVAHFLAQVLYESGNLARVVENLNYSAARLREVFPTRFTPAQAAAYANQPMRIGNKVYADRLGNGSEKSGDGYRFRGRGLIQLTGRANYASFSAFIGVDVVRAPGKVGTTYAVDSAVYFWSSRGLAVRADADDLAGVTRLVTGAQAGLAGRRALLERLKRQLGISPRDVA